MEYDLKKNVKNYLINLNVKMSSLKVLKSMKFIHKEKMIKKRNPNHILEVSKSYFKMKILNCFIIFLLGSNRW